MLAGRIADSPAYRARRVFPGSIRTSNSERSFLYYVSQIFNSLTVVGVAPDCFQSNKSSVVSYGCLCCSCNNCAHCSFVFTRYCPRTPDFQSFHSYLTASWDFHEFSWTRTTLGGVLYKSSVLERRDGEGLASKKRGEDLAKEYRQVSSRSFEHSCRL